MVHDLGGGMPCFDRKKPIVMKTTNSKVFFYKSIFKGTRRRMSFARYKYVCCPIYLLTEHSEGLPF